MKWARFWSGQTILRAKKPDAVRPASLIFHRISILFKRGFVPIYKIGKFNTKGMAYLPEFRQIQHLLSYLVS
jgi:hypothetical protein